MARQDFSLTDETIRTMSGFVQKIADEYGCSDKYIYSILANGSTDPFAKFQRLYAACVRAKAAVCYWDNKLAAIRARYEQQLQIATPMECLLQKIESNADGTNQMLRALKDGEIDAQEAKNILAAVKRERDVLDRIERMCQLTEEEVPDWGGKAVSRDTRDIVAPLVRKRK